MARERKVSKVQAWALAVRYSAYCEAFARPIGDKGRANSISVWSYSLAQSQDETGVVLVKPEILADNAAFYSERAELERKRDNETQYELLPCPE